MALQILHFFFCHRINECYPSSALAIFYKVGIMCNMGRFNAKSNTHSAHSHNNQMDRIIAI